jgi:serine/threonine protein kinase
MPLSAGTRLGPYEILAPIGIGGMGEVYRARDTKLDRDVAIKVLPPDFAQDPERLARFEREAKMLASLNHPNIAQIYGIEDRALVMELVAGETLQGRLLLETALNYARQIADALEAAHDKNIIHRDLKPANIMITAAGVVKVLDFGLAAVAQVSDPSNPANSPTLTISPTRAGMILGTAGYMSPEQARGKTVDKRADIWAFGVVLCEMLSGKPLFKGETVSDTLAQVLTKEPDWDQVPAKVRRLLRSVPAKGTQAAAHLGSRYGCCGACDRTRRRLVSPLPRETSRACPRSLSGRGPGLEPGRHGAVPGWARTRLHRRGSRRRSSLVDSLLRFARFPRTARHRGSQLAILVARWAVHRVCRRAAAEENR